MSVTNDLKMQQKGELGSVLRMDECAKAPDVYEIIDRANGLLLYNIAIDAVEKIYRLISGENQECPGDASVVFDGLVELKNIRDMVFSDMVDWHAIERDRKTEEW